MRCCRPQQERLAEWQSTCQKPLEGSIQASICPDLSSHMAPVPCCMGCSRGTAEAPKESVDSHLRGDSWVLGLGAGHQAHRACVVSKAPNTQTAPV